MRISDSSTESFLARFSTISRAFSKERYEMFLAAKGIVRKEQGRKLFLFISFVLHQIR